MRARKFAALSVQDEDRVDTIGSCGSLLLFSIEANWPALYVYDVISYLDRRYCLVHHLVLICCFKSLVYDTSSQKYKVLVFCYKMNGVLELYCLCTLDYKANDNRHLLALLDFPGSTPSIRQSVPFISNNPQLLEIIRSHGTCILFLKFSFAMSIGSINYKSLTRLSTWHPLCLH